jgi:hypothetical protein
MMKLKVKDIYVYYDFPIIFSAVNEDGDTFICLFAEETDSHLRYICAKISPTTLFELENNQKDIRAVFENPEKVFNLLLNAQSEEPVEVSETSEDITPFLPDEGLFIGTQRSEISQVISIPIPSDAAPVKYDKIDSGLSNYEYESRQSGYHVHGEVIFSGVPQWLTEAA